MRREWSVALAIGVLCVALGAYAPGYFSSENLLDLLLINVPVLLVAIGATLVILTGEIDISVGSMFAVCSVIGGGVAKTGVSVSLVVTVTCAVGATLGVLNGALVAYAGIPSIVVTLAAMVAFRDALRWVTQGSWVEGLPPTFQWLGFSQAAFPMIVGAFVVILLIGVTWAMRNLGIGRAVYATGSNAEGARLAGIDTALIKLSVFAIGGVLTAAGAVVNSARFNQVPSNTGLGLEMKVVAAVVVGGAAITGGRGTIAGTVLGVVLLGAVGPALTFLGVAAQWERALQGTIILAAVAIDALPLRRAVIASRRASAGV
jgi:rhamnose transport system permease protein